METKKWYLSKTIWGVLITILGFVLSQVLKVDIQLPDSEVLTAQDLQVATEQIKNAKSNLFSQIMIVIGTLLSIYGRFKANTKVTV